MIMEKNIFTVFYRNFDPFGKIDDGEGNLGWDNAKLKYLVTRREMLFLVLMLDGLIIKFFYYLRTEKLF